MSYPILDYAAIPAALCAWPDTPASHPPVQGSQP